MTLIKSWSSLRVQTATYKLVNKTQVDDDDDDNFQPYTTYLSLCSTNAIIYYHYYYYYPYHNERNNDPLLKLTVSFEVMYFLMIQ